MMDIVNTKQEDLDVEDMMDNIEEVVVKDNLSPKMIRSMKEKNGKQFKKHRPL